MRWILYLVPLLCGCSTSAVRCDANLQPINPPAAPVVTSAPNQATPARRTL